MDWDDSLDGEWEPPMIDNPEYKGEWKPRQIGNPFYMGKWVHPMIPNPDYNPEDGKDFAKYDEICKIGFDLWQVKSGTIFDNVLITDDPAKAKEIGNEVWKTLKPIEKAMKEEQDEAEKKAEEEAKNSDENEDNDEYNEVYLKRIAHNYKDAFHIPLLYIYSSLRLEQRCSRAFFVRHKCDECIWPFATS
jgi:calreticulin